MIGCLGKLMFVVIFIAACIIIAKECGGDLSGFDCGGVPLP